MRLPLSPMEFADAVINLPLDQAYALIRVDRAAEEAAIQARHTPEATGGADVVALPAPTAHPAEEAA